MSDQEQDEPCQQQGDEELDPLAEQQQHKGYGEDEGEREQSLPDE